MQLSRKKSSLHIISGLIVAFLALLSLALQYYKTDLGFVYFMSYFTTLCNLLIAISLTCSILFPSSQAGRYFSQLSVQSAIALYIFIVSIVYNTVLRGILVLNGLDYVLDNMVHVVNPILYILYWLFFRTRERLQWTDGIKWIIFPLLYLVYSLLRGAKLNWYPYIFLNVDKFGYPTVFFNIAIIILVFLAAGMALIAITRKTATPAGVRSS